MRTTPLVFMALLSCGGSQPMPVSGHGAAATTPISTPTPAPTSTTTTNGWTVPAAWHAETLPFPLEFAPDIPHRGVERLRLAPGFNKPDSPEYWSGVFAWELQDDGALDARTLEGELVAYYRGLVAAVNGERHEIATVDSGRFAARFEDGADGTVTGELDTYDPFATGAPIKLHFAIAKRSCTGSADHAVVVAFSPRPTEDGVWLTLRALADAHRC